MMTMAYPSGYATYHNSVIPHKCLTKNSGMKNMITKKKSR